jgi:hypothetical protein
MKKLLCLFFTLFLVCGSLAQSTPEDPVRANATMTLVWTPNDPIELVQSYNVSYERDGVIKVFAAPAPGVELVTLLRNEPNGVYTITVTAVNSDGLESEPSLPLYVFWYGRPTPPKGIVVEIRTR